MWRTTAPEETFAFGEAIGSILKAGDTVFLIGDLGTGKSVFARGVASALQIHEPMASPTFTIMYPYSGTLPLYHFDLYRLEEPEEFYEAGLEEYVGGDGVAMIEWPDHADILPEPRMEITIERGEEDDTRFLSIQTYGMNDRFWASALTRWEVTA